MLAQKTAVCFTSILKNNVVKSIIPNYPEDGDVTAEVKVWEIHYPLDIKSNPKYLATEPPKKQGD